MTDLDPASAGKEAEPALDDPDTPVAVPSPAEEGDADAQPMPPPV